MDWVDFVRLIGGIDQENEENKKHAQQAGR